MAVLLGLAGAISFGGLDFLGGQASKRSAVASVVIATQVVALALAVVVVTVDDVPVPSGGDIALTIAGGMVGMVSLGLLFQGLATGRMGVVAPVTAVLAAVIPLGWALARGERPGGLALTGVLVALASVALVAREPDADDARRGLARPLTLALLAGAGFGVAISVFSEVADGTGYWVLFFNRVGSVTVFGTALLATGRLTRIEPGDRVPVLLAGALNVVGDAAVMEGFRQGLTSIVAPVANLAPAITVLLAFAILKERLQRHQLVGVAGAVAGLALIAGG